MSPARSDRTARSDPSDPSDRSDSAERTACQRWIAGFLIVLQALPPTLYASGAWAQATLPITPDRSVSGQRPVVNAGANGVPFVQIAPPSSAGVSHNRFTDYNVGTSGVILNNSGANSQTQLGGWVSGNPMLGNNKARVILNEVTGSASSRLNGFTEVAGNRANVIVANPNGISCDGCGFINAPRATLTTGTPQFGADGSVAGFNVQRGQISIDGAGLDARGADQIDLIARSLRVNAEVWANRLDIATGANQVDYANGQATRQAGAGDAPTVAIDVSQLGGMYANSIRMVGTESGVGVNSAGIISALTGELQLDSAGDVRITGGQVQAKGDITLRSAQNISNAGTVHAEGNATINATGALQNTNLIAAAGDLQGSAASLANAGIIGAGINAQGQVAAVVATVVAANVTLSVTGTLQSNGQILAGNNATLTADTITLDHGKVNAGNQAVITAADTLSNRGGELIANQAVLNTGAGLDNTNGALQAQTLAVAAPRIDNTQGTILQTGTSGQLTLSAQQGIINHQGRIAANATDLTLAGSQIDNSGGKIEHAGSGTLHIEAAGTLTNTQGSISSNGSASLQVRSIANADGTVQTQGALSITAMSGIGSGINSGTGSGIDNGINSGINSGINNGIDNARGKLLAGGAASMATQGAFNNTQGFVQADQLVLQADSVSNGGGQILQFGIGDTVIAVTGAFNNAGGTLGSNAANLNLTAGSVDNTGGLLTHVGSGAFNLTSSGAVVNAGGQILANKALTVSAQSLTNTADASQAGLIQAGATATVTASGDVNNAGGVIAGNGNLTLSGSSINNQGGAIQTANNADLNINAAKLLDNSASGKIAASGALVVQAGSANNQAGQITSGSTLTTTVATALDNTQGVIAAIGNATVNTGTLLTNKRGVIGSVQGSLIATSGGSTDNTSGRLEAAQDVTVVASGMANNQGVVSGANTSIDTQTQALDNTGGKIGARNALTISSGQLANGGGLLQATGAMHIDTHGQALTNTQSGDSGGIIGQDTVTVKAGTLNNGSGFIGGVGAMTITANQIDNIQNGSIVGQNSLAVSSGNFNNTGGGLQVQGDATFNLGGGTLDNGGSLLRSGGTLTVNAGAINNTSTLGANQGIEGTSVKLAAATIDNTGGAIRADNQATLAATGTLNNTQGLVSSANGVAINAAAVTNTLGTLIAGNNLTLTAGSLSGDGKLLSLGDMTVKLAGGFNNIGQVQTNKNLDFTSGETVTNSGLIRAGKTLNLNAANLDNLLAGEISAGVTNITVPGTINNQGLIDGRTTRITTGVLNNTGRIYGDHVAVQAGTLTNDGTGVIASRANMDLGVGTLINREHAIIYSAGNLNLGGALTSDDLATGSADRRWCTFGTQPECLSGMHDKRGWDQNLQTAAAKDFVVCDDRRAGKLCSTNTDWDSDQ